MRDITLPVELGGGVVQTKGNIISLCGERRRGKDFLCEYLIQKHGAGRLSFSDEVRYIVEDVFPWLNVFMIDNDKKDIPFIHPCNPNSLTPRDITKLVGRLRDVYPQIFVSNFIKRNMSRINSSDSLFVITDFRTVDEAAYFIKPFGVPTIKVVSPEADAKYDRDSFESYIRHYEADYEFVNEPMNGDMSKFESFFDKFLEENPQIKEYLK